MKRRLMDDGAKKYFFVIISIIVFFGVYLIYSYNNNLDTGKVFFTKETDDSILLLSLEDKIKIVNSERDSYLELLSKELDYEPIECNEFLVKRFHDACYMDFVVINPLDYSQLCEEIEDLNTRSGCNVLVNNALYFIKNK